MERARVYLERPVNYRDQERVILLLQRTFMRRTDSVPPASPPYYEHKLNQKKRKKKEREREKRNSHQRTSSNTGIMCLVSHNWAHSRFGPAKLNFISVAFCRCGMDSGPVASRCLCLFPCLRQTSQVHRVPHLLNCVLRYIPLARPGPWRVSATLVPGLAARERPLWGVSGWLRCARLRYETACIHRQRLALQRDSAAVLSTRLQDHHQISISPPSNALLCSIVFFFLGCFFLFVCRKPSNLTQTAGPPGANSSIWAVVFFFSFLLSPSSFRCCDCRRPCFTPSRRGGLLCFSVYNPSKSTSSPFAIARVCFWIMWRIATIAPR